MREENNTNYEIYLKEEEKRREEREKKLQEEYGSKVPYEGMSEEYINYTMVGRYNERERRKFFSWGVSYNNIYLVCKMV